MRFSDLIFETLCSIKIKTDALIPGTILFALKISLDSRGESNIEGLESFWRGLGSYGLGYIERSCYKLTKTN